jgi:hypothetical protein
MVHRHPADGPYPPIACEAHTPRAMPRAQRPRPTACRTRSISVDQFNHASHAKPEQPSSTSSFTICGQPHRTSPARSHLRWPTTSRNGAMQGTNLRPIRTSSRSEKVGCSATMDSRVGKVFAVLPPVCQQDLARRVDDEADGLEPDPRPQRNGSATAKAGRGGNSGRPIVEPLTLSTSHTRAAGTSISISVLISLTRADGTRDDSLVRSTFGEEGGAHGLVHQRGRDQPPGS